MKKSIKTLTFGLLTVGMLAGCNKPAPVADWTAEQKSIMSEHLHGVVLPFFKSDATVKYDSEYAEVVITADVAGTETKDYGAKFTAADGWEDITDQYNVPAAAMRETFFAFQKAVTVTEGTRYISLQFASMVGQEFSAEGKFALYASDPFNYEWPAEEWASVIDVYFKGSTDVVPPIQADRYEPYHPEAGGFATFCYMESTTQDAGYSAILTQAGWDVQEEKDEDGYFVAVAPSGMFAVAYLYVTNMGSLNIWLAPAPAKTYDAFPSEALAATVAAYAEDGAVAFDFPVFAKEGAKFTYEEDDTNDMYIDYGFSEYANAVITASPVVEDDYTAYRGAFVTAGWEVVDANTASGFAATKAIENVGTASVDVSFASGELEIIVYIIPKPFPAEEWPAADIAALLPARVTDVVLPFNGEASGYELGSVFGTYVVVTVEAGQEETLIAAYATALKEAGWTELGADRYGDMHYASPNNQIDVCAYSEDAGTITITFEAIPVAYQTFAAAVAGAAEELGVASIPLVDPGVANATKYEISCDAEEGEGYIYIYAASGVDQAAVDAYNSALATAGWSFLGKDSYGDSYYSSPDGSVTVCPYVGSGRMVVYFYFNS